MNELQELSAEELKSKLEDYQQWQWAENEAAVKNELERRDTPIEGIQTMSSEELSQINWVAEELRDSGTSIRFISADGSNWNEGSNQSKSGSSREGPSYA